MPGSSGRTKTVRKSMWYASHGTQNVDPGVLKRREREKLKPPKPEMFPSVAEAFKKR